MASPFDRLMDTIRPHLPGVVDPAVKQELFPACHDFFRKSDAWRESIPFTLEAGKSTAEVMPYTGRIERLLYVLHGDRQVGGVTMPDTHNGVVLFPFAASDTMTYNAVVSLTVSDPVQRDAFPIVPYDLVTKYREELMHGILSRMMAQPSKPYTNLSLGQYYLTKFNGGISRAKNAANTGNTFRSQNWAFPQTFNRRKINGA